MPKSIGSHTKHTLDSNHHEYIFIRLRTTQTFQITRWNKSNHRYFIDSSIPLDEFSCRKLFSLSISHPLDLYLSPSTTLSLSVSFALCFLFRHIPNIRHIRNNSIHTTTFRAANYQSKCSCRNFVHSSATRIFFFLLLLAHSHSLADDGAHRVCCVCMLRYDTYFFGVYPKCTHIQQTLNVNLPFLLRPFA